MCLDSGKLSSTYFLILVAVHSTIPFRRTIPTLTYKILIIKVDLINYKTVIVIYLKSGMPV